MLNEMSLLKAHVIELTNFVVLSLSNKIYELNTGIAGLCFTTPAASF